LASGAPVEKRGKRIVLVNLLVGGRESLTLNPPKGRKGGKKREKRTKFSSNLIAKGLKCQRKKKKKELYC